MTGNLRPLIAPAAIVGAAVLLPFVGAALGGREVTGLFQFPPSLAIRVDYPRFSWIAVALALTPFAALAAAWARARRGNPAPLQPTAHGRVGPVPWWGFTAALWTLGWWVVAWSEYEAFAPFRRYTFFPLWLGFVVTANALVVRRRGTCVMTGTPGRWLGLFGVSAGFWWIFEWLNRFTHNWHYLGVEDFGAAAYAVHATLCFSTVLPAVSAVAELLGTSRRVTEACKQGPRLPWLATPGAGVALITIGLVGLVGAGARPWLFYAALWTAPLALAFGQAVLTRSGGLPFMIATGDWRVVAMWAGAAMICGGFWELWNFHSTPKWIYTVPYADRWHVFEMPMLGYLGYLPFGLECYLVAERVLGSNRPCATKAVATPYRSADRRHDSAVGENLTRFRVGPRGPADR